MADGNISQITLPNGSIYNIKDTVSGYTTNTGTITKVQTTAGAHTTINVSSGAAAFNVPTKTSHLTNDGDGTSNFATMADIGSLGGGTITGVKTTAGAHTTIDVSSGNANFNVPTKTSHLINDSGFLTAVPASGVTAGTYDGGATKNSGFYVPSFTVDSTGRITSATDLGNLIPEMGTSNETSAYTGCVITPWNFSQTLRNLSTAIAVYVLSAGSTSKTITISSDVYSSYSYGTNFRVADVQCYDVSTFEPVLVDWSTSRINSSGGSLVLTVSIASAYTNNICIFPILTYVGGM